METSGMFGLFFFFFKQKFKNTNIVPESPQSHSQELQLLQNAFYQGNNSKSRVVEHMKGKVVFFSFCLKAMEAALGWAELSLKGSAFFLLSAALCLPAPPCRGCLCIICYQGRQWDSWCIRKACCMRALTGLGIPAAVEPLSQAERMLNATFIITWNHLKILSIPVIQPFGLSPY